MKAMVYERPASGHFDLRPVGVVTIDHPTWDEWEALGLWLQRIDGAIQWWIGDWVNVGELEFGERAAQAVDATGWEIKTLLQYRWVCEKVAIAQRVEGLSFFHHREVADLDAAAQEAWLARALEGDDGAKWGVDRLREELNQAKRGAAGDVWVLVKATDAQDAEALVERFVAEGRVAKIRGRKAREVYEEVA